MAVGLSVGLLLLLGLMVYYLWRRKKKKKGRSQYEELLSSAPSVPACTAPVILVSKESWTRSVKDMKGARRALELQQLWGKTCSILDPETTAS